MVKSIHTKRTILVSAAVAVIAAVSAFLAFEQRKTDESEYYFFLKSHFLPDVRDVAGYWPKDLAQVQSYLKKYAASHGQSLGDPDSYAGRIERIQLNCRPSLTVLRADSSEFVGTVSFGWTLGGSRELDFYARS